MIIEEIKYRTEFREKQNRNTPLHYRRFYYLDDRAFYIDKLESEHPVFTICEVKNYLPHPISEGGVGHYVINTWEDAEYALCSILKTGLDRR